MRHNHRYQRLRAIPPAIALGNYRRSSAKMAPFLLTTSQIVFHPKRFYRSSTSRGQIDAAYQFAQIHWWISALLFGVAAWFHWQSEAALQNLKPPHWVSPALFLAFPLIAYLALSCTIALAARLTVWEARYRGFRLPHNVVLRGLYYHSATSCPWHWPCFSPAPDIITSCFLLSSPRIFILYAAKSSSPRDICSTPTGSACGGGCLRTVRSMILSECSASAPAPNLQII